LSDTPDIVKSNTWGNTIERICTWALMDDKQGHDSHQLLLARSIACGRLSGADLHVDRLEDAPVERRAFRTAPSLTQKIQTTSMITFTPSKGSATTGTCS
jgi:hypothetical protein